MKVTLQVKGREVTFSEEELTTILEKYFNGEKSEVTPNTNETSEVSTEGEWFVVTPLAIDQNLFKGKRQDSRQEEARQLILEAFEEVKKNPKYAKTFKIMIPKKTWSTKTVKELKKLASKLGDHNADWVEQALEWAQKIANGKSWEDICNKPDTANWYRIVVWKNGYVRLTGGSRIYSSSLSKSVVYGGDYCDDITIGGAVPSVVAYD